MWNNLKLQLIRWWMIKKYFRSASISQKPLLFNVIYLESHWMFKLNRFSRIFAELQEFDFLALALALSSSDWIVEETSDYRKEMGF